MSAITHNHPSDAELCSTCGGRGFHLPRCSEGGGCEHEDLIILNGFQTCAACGVIPELLDDADTEEST